MIPVLKARAANLLDHGGMSKLEMKYLLARDADNSATRNQDKTNPSSTQRSEP